MAYLWHNFIQPLRRVQLTKNAALLTRYFHVGPSVLSATVNQVSVAQDKKTVFLQFDDGEKNTYHAVWLKHCCRCPKCWHTTTMQSLVPPENILPSYTLNEARIDGENLMLSWAEDNEPEHKGFLPLQWLKENAYSENIIDGRIAAAKPTPILGKMAEFDCNDIMEDEEKRLDWMVRVYEDGICMVRNVPTESGTVAKIAERMYANLQPTPYHAYGEVLFEVITEEDPVNVGNKSIPAHMDVMYFESPPGIQFLHCLRFDACIVGGGNVITDTFYAAEEFRKQYPVDFKILAEVKATFLLTRYNHEFGRPAHYRALHPHIVLENDEIVAIYWNPQYNTPLLAPPEMVEPFFAARWRFADFLARFPTRHEFCMNPGDMVVFNNRRMTHERKGFTANGGVRHLQGCGVGIDDFRSQVVAGCITSGRKVKHLRVGNKQLGF